MVTGDHIQRGIPSLTEAAGASAIALDFETASISGGSVCSVGLAWITAGQVTHAAHRLIRPHDMRFDPRHVSIHGIQPHDVEDEPEFPAIWDELLPHLEATPLLLAHNAGFDIGVLRAALRHYGLPVPVLSYLCTVKVARAAWPDLPNHKLPTVAGHIGFDLRHHAADSDAAACASIALRAVTDSGRSGLDETAMHYRIAMGRIGPDFHQPCSSAREAGSGWQHRRRPPWWR